MKITFFDLKASHADLPTCPASRIWISAPGTFSCLDCGRVLMMASIEVFEDFPLDNKTEKSNYGPSPLVGIMKAMIGMPGIPISSVGGLGAVLAGSKIRTTKMMRPLSTGTTILKMTYPDHGGYG